MFVMFAVVMRSSQNYLELLPSRNTYDISIRVDILASNQLAPLTQIYMPSIMKRVPVDKLITDFSRTAISSIDLEIS